MHEVLKVAGVAGAACDWLTIRFLHAPWQKGQSYCIYISASVTGDTDPDSLSPASLFHFSFGYVCLYYDCLRLHRVRVPDVFDDHDWLALRIFNRFFDIWATLKSCSIFDGWLACRIQDLRIWLPSINPHLGTPFLLKDGIRSYEQERWYINTEA